MWEFLQKLKELQPESKNLVLTGLTGEVLGEKALVSNGKLVWASVAGGFLEQHDQQIEQLEVNGIVLVDGEKIFGEVVGGQKKIVLYWWMSKQLRLIIGKSQLSGSYWASFLPGHLNPMNNLQKRTTPVCRLRELPKVKLLRC